VGQRRPVSDKRRFVVACQELHSAKRRSIAACQELHMPPFLVNLYLARLCSCLYDLYCCVR
jgi:hypothetical protein